MCVSVSCRHACVSELQACVCGACLPACRCVCCTLMWQPHETFWRGLCGTNLEIGSSACAGRERVLMHLL